MEASKLFETTVKRFNFKYITRSKHNLTQKNLYESISRYPNLGLGATVRYKLWPENRYFKIMKIKVSLI